MSSKKQKKKNKKKTQQIRKKEIKNKLEKKSFTASDRPEILKNIKKVYQEALSDSTASQAVLKFYGQDLDDLPSKVRGYSFGCGHPAGAANIEKGLKILDIGCGAGVDAIFAAKKTGVSGSVSAFDITDEMVEKARENAESAGCENTEFRVADAGEMPYEDSCFDLALSNAVIHLVPDTAQVFSEIFRVLKPQGRLVTSDIMTDSMIPKSLVKQYLKSDGLFLYGGIKIDKDYFKEIRNAGFKELEILNKTRFDVMPEFEKIMRNAGKIDDKEVQENLAKAAKVNFFVVTYEARKGDAGESISLPCKCGTLSDHRFYEVANVTINQSLMGLLKRGRLNDFYCPNCNEHLTYPRPFMFHDMEARIMVNVFPEIMRAQQENLEAAMAQARENAKQNFMRMELVFGPAALKKLLKY